MMSSSENNQMESEKEQKLEEIKSWMESQVEWKGKTDDDFITIFLSSCDFDVEQTKKTIFTYYENRRKIPQWWTNRSLKDPLMRSAMDLRINTIIKEKKVNYPTLFIIRLARIGSKSNSHLFEPHFKLCTAHVEALMRRPNIRLNGEIIIVDFRKYSFWPASRMFSPTFLKDFNNTFNAGSPIKIMKLIVLGTPYIGNAFIHIVRPFMSKQLSESFHLLSSDLSSLHELVPKEVLPEEYGGEAGPMSEHEEATRNEELAIFDLIEEDDKFDKIE